MERDELITLFYKYRSNQCSPEEAERLIQHIQSGQDGELVESLIGDVSVEDFSGEISEIADLNESLDRVLLRVQQNKKKRSEFTVFYRRLPMRWVAATAAVLLTVFVIRHLDGKRESDPEAASLELHEIAPGGNRATITVDDGRVLVLKENQEGIMSKDDALIYADGSSINGLEPTQFVTLSTPRAGRYAVTLSDGTNVWLNAESELVYPIRFDKNERNVYVKGEAYFEVAHDQNRPFIAHTNKQDIRVLGTKFNIYAYDEEAVQRTTLVQGAVIVQNNNLQQSFRLKPGQQAVNEANDLSILEVDTLEYVSWKDDVMILNSYDLPEILRQLERWYDVEFGEIPSGIKPVRVFGMIHRNVPLNDVLKTLSDNYNAVQFKVNGRRITMSE